MSLKRTRTNSGEISESISNGRLPESNHKEIVRLIAYINEVQQRQIHALQKRVDELERRQSNACHKQSICLDMPDSDDETVNTL